MENRSSSHKPVTSLLILLIIGVIILGILVALQNREIHRLAEESKVLELVAVEPLPAPTPSSQSEQGDNLIVSQITVAGKYTITHYCDGSIEHTPFDGTPSYCLGENTLVFKDGDRIKTITTFTSVNVEGSLQLTNALLVPATNNQERILIAFAQDHDFVFDIGDFSVRQISNYPSTGDAIWNSSGTKALVVIYTCGATGCDTEALVGYDLDRDIAKDVTKEKASPKNTEQLPNGAKLPYWSEVKWTSDSKFSATIINPDGVKKVVTGTF